MSSKPVFAFVTGAYHQDKCLASIIKELQGRGYEAYSTKLESAGIGGPGVSDDVQSIRDKLLLPLTYQGKDVILIPHSLAGVAGSGAVKNLTKKDWQERGDHSRGHQGGVVGLIWLCAYILKEGTSVMDFLAGREPVPWVTVEMEKGVAHANDSGEIFYGDVDKDLAEELATQLVPHSVPAFMTPLPERLIDDSYFDGRRAYVRTLKDKALPLEDQDLMLRDSKLDWIIKTMDSDHSPFVSHTTELADLLVELSQEFARAGSNL